MLCKLGPGQSEVAEELCSRLERKEKMLQELLSDRNRQAMEHDAEIRELLQAMSTKQQWSRVSCVQRCGVVDDFDLSSAAREQFSFAFGIAWLELLSV